MKHQPHPLRIQRKRTKGWRLPEGAVCCTRPGPWGNPFDSAMQFRVALESVLSVGNASTTSKSAAIRMGDIANNLDKLRGKQLACWCSLDKPCHVDVLAELANREQQP